MIEALARLSTEGLTFYFWGGAALVVTPPAVAVTFLWFLFRTRPESGQEALRRLLGAAAMGLSIAFALGATGVALLQPASPDLFLGLIVFCIVFALFGAGQLYWTEDDY